jgi:hypothetical protein
MPLKNRTIQEMAKFDHLNNREFVCLFTSFKSCSMSIAVLAFLLVILGNFAKKCSGSTSGTLGGVWTGSCPLSLASRSDNSLSAIIKKVTWLG